MVFIVIFFSFRLSSSHCDKYKILGFDCELDIISVKNDTRTAMLQLASYDGTSFFIRLYGKKLGSVSIGIQVIVVLTSSRMKSNLSYFVGNIRR